MLMEFFIGTRIARAVADPERAAVLKTLAPGELSAGELERRLGMTSETLRAHLETLLEAALIETRSEGCTLYCRISERSEGILDNLLGPYYHGRGREATGGTRFTYSPKTLPL